MNSASVNISIVLSESTQARTKKSFDSVWKIKLKCFNSLPQLESWPYKLFEFNALHQVQKSLSAEIWPSGSPTVQLCALEKCFLAVWVGWLHFYQHSQSICSHHCIHLEWVSLSRALARYWTVSRSSFRSGSSAKYIPKLSDFLIWKNQDLSLCCFWCLNVDGAWCHRVSLTLYTVMIGTIHRSKERKPNCWSAGQLLRCFACPLRVAVEPR